MKKIQLNAGARLKAQLTAATSDDADQALALLTSAFGKPSKKRSGMVSWDGSSIQLIMESTKDKDYTLSFFAITEYMDGVELYAKDFTDFKKKLAAVAKRAQSECDKRIKDIQKQRAQFDKLM